MHIHHINSLIMFSVIRLFLKCAVITILLLLQQPTFQNIDLLKSIGLGLLLNGLALSWDIWSIGECYNFALSCILGDDVMHYVRCKTSRLIVYMPVPTIYFCVLKCCTQSTLTCNILLFPYIFLIKMRQRVESVGSAD
jgi:uncharacterized membrane protein